MGLKKPVKFSIVTSKNVLMSFKILSLGLAYIFMWVFYYCFIVFKLLIDFSIKIFEVMGQYGEERTKNKGERKRNKKYKRAEKRGYDNY